MKNLSLLVALLFCPAVSWAEADNGLTLNWSHKILTVSGATLPGGHLEILYPEAFCRKGSTQRDWGKTVLPYKTELIAAEPRLLRFRTTIQSNTVMLHEVQVGSNGLELRFDLKNQGTQPLDLEWFQPACIRVDRFTGLDQTNYTSRSFIFTERGLTKLNQTRRTENAMYRGGQVYVPKGINLADVNPRPICQEQPVKGLIGCFSADGQQLLATASNCTHELFEGIFVCLHSDPHVGGLAPGEAKQIRAKIYLLKNDPQQLLNLYRHDFPEEARINWVK